MRVVLAGGGTGGHVYPAIAIAGALREAQPDIELVFLGTSTGIESRAVSQAGESIHFIRSGGIVGKNISNRAKGLFSAATGVAQALFFLRKYRPDIVVGTGGFVMAPVLFASRIMKIPFVIQEQNSFPGLTTRKFSTSASVVCIAYPDAIRHLGKAKCIVTGNPLRKQMTDHKRTLNSTGDPRILITGGSLGARSINRAVAESLESLCRIAKVIWQFGKTGIPEFLPQSTLAKLQDSGRLTASPFFDDMQVKYEESNLVICRAGAMTLSELSVFGLPALLIPFPHAAHDHQTANAKSYFESGAAHIIKDNELTGERLLKECKLILSNLTLQSQMAQSMKSLAKPNAARDIADIIFRLLK